MRRAGELLLVAGRRRVDGFDDVDLAAKERRPGRRAVPPPGRDPARDRRAVEAALGVHVSVPTFGSTKPGVPNGHVPVRQVGSVESKALLRSLHVIDDTCVDGPVPLIEYGIDTGVPAGPASSISDGTIMIVPIASSSAITASGATSDCAITVDVGLPQPIASHAMTKASTNEPRSTLPA